MAQGGKGKQGTTRRQREKHAARGDQHPRGGVRGQEGANVFRGEIGCMAEEEEQGDGSCERERAKERETERRRK